MSAVFVGDEGTDIVIDCGIDISTATVRRIVVQKRENGPKIYWVAVPASATAMKYTTLAGDIDVSGTWKLQAYVETPSWKGHGEVVEMNVLNKLQKTPSNRGV